MIEGAGHAWGVFGPVFISMLPVVLSLLGLRVALWGVGYVVRQWRGGRRVRGSRRV